MTSAKCGDDRFIDITKGLDTTHHAPKCARFHGRSNVGCAGAGSGGDLSSAVGWGPNGCGVSVGGAGGFMTNPTSSISGYAFDDHRLGW